MKCSRIRSLISEYVHGELSAMETQQLDRHIASCDSCRREVAAFRSAMSALARPVGHHVAPDVLAGVLERVYESRRRRNFVPVLGFASAACALCVCAWLLVPRGVEQPAPAKPAAVTSAPYAPSVAEPLAKVEKRPNISPQKARRRHVAGMLPILTPPEPVSEPEEVVYPNGARVSTVDAEAYDASRTPSGLEEAPMPLPNGPVAGIQDNTPVEVSKRVYPRVGQPIRENVHDPYPAEGSPEHRTEPLVQP